MEERKINKEDNMEYYIVDAFAENLFGGNQAGVCVLKEPIEADLMQNIAIENNVSETACLVNQRRA